LGTKKKTEGLGTEVPQRGPGRSPGRGSGDKVPRKIKLFGETKHNIFIKIQQTAVVVVTG